MTLEIWNNDWCGADKGPTFEIKSLPWYDVRSKTVRGGYGTQGTHLSFDPIHKGDTLQWDNLNGKLGLVSGLRVSGNSLWFSLFGRSGDDFCPKRFRVVTYDGTVYRSSEMNDWVDKSKGYQTRTAYRCSNRASCCPNPDRSYVC